MTNASLNELNDKLHIIAQQVRHAFDTNNHSHAKQLLHQGLDVLPNHPIMLSDLAHAESQLGNNIQAYDYLQQALRHYDNSPYHFTNPKYGVYDTLVAVCYKLKRFEEACFYAKKSMADKKHSVLQNQPKPLPTLTQTGLHPDPSKNIIAYSLFGDDSRYCETAVLNTILAKSIYPEWTCRFYVDDSVPSQTIARLKSNHAQIVMMEKTDKHYFRLFWRFLVAGDKDVHCFVVRDADSLLSYKERYAVNDWLKSGKFFHIMRDGIEHSELILAGMWGGYTGAFPNIQDEITEFFGQLSIPNKTADQDFLREYLWVTVNQSVLVHDAYHLEANSLPFPDYPLSDIEKIPYFHVGMIDAHNNPIITKVNPTDKKTLEWSLMNEQNKPICRYRSVVRQKDDGTHALQIHLPYFYGQHIKNGDWYILPHE